MAKLVLAVNEIGIPLAGITLGGELHLPEDAPGIVLFAHGTGSSRHSPRNQYVARVIRQGGLGTLLFDLLTSGEEQAEASTGRLRFNIPLLAGRLIEVTRWALGEAAGVPLNAGYFGSSTGAAAALMAAADLGETIGAVVSRGGRPDLAAGALERVTAPTLLIVGGDDTAVLRLNEEACDRLVCEKELRIVAGASHLFEEAGALETVAGMAADWFVRHLRRRDC